MVRNSSKSSKTKKSKKSILIGSGIVMKICTSNKLPSISNIRRRWITLRPNWKVSESMSFLLHPFLHYSMLSMLILSLLIVHLLIDDAPKGEKKEEENF